MRRSTPLALLALLAPPAAAQEPVPAADLARIEAACPDRPFAPPAAPRRLLVFGHCQGFRHSAIPYAAAALAALGRRTGAFSVAVGDDPALLRPASLMGFDALCLNNTTQLKLDPEIRKGLLEFVAGGRGLVGIHGATDNFPDWPEGQELLGGVFDGHPWTAGGTWAVKIVEPGHPLAVPFGGRDPVLSDEIYRTRPVRLRENCRVLLALDLADPRNFRVDGLRSDDFDLPLAWIRSFGQGRVFYCALGHNHHLWWEPALLRHYLAGIQYALGDLPADAAPRPFDPAALLTPERVEELLGAAAAWAEGESREPLLHLSFLFRMARRSPALLGRLEAQILGRLLDPVPPGCRRFLCQELSLFATPSSLPVLAPWLTDPERADHARYVLERIPGPEANAALREALGRAADRERVGLAAALGRRRDEAAAPALAALAREAEPELAAAALAALAEIGGPEAEKTFVWTRANRQGELAERAAAGLIAEAERLLAAGQAEAARGVFAGLLAPAEAAPVRTAALRGLALAEPGRAAARVLAALTGPDPALQAMGSRLVRELLPPAALQEVAAALGGLAPEAKVQLLTALGDRGERAVLPAVTAEAGRPEEPVRVAALRALGTLGDASSVALLAQAAGQAEGKEEREAAQAALSLLGGPGVDEALLAALPAAPAAVKTALIQAAAERRSPGGTAPVFRLAMADPERQVRVEAVKALRVLAGPAELPALLDRLAAVAAGPEQVELSRTAAAVARQAGPAEAQAAPVLAALGRAAGAPAQAALLGVLGRLGVAPGLPPLRAHMRSGDEELQAAAIRALAEWPDDSPLSDLKVAAGGGGASPRNRALALRGFVGLIGRSPAGEPEKAALFREALLLAPNAVEKNQVLSALGGVAGPEALALAASLLEDREAAGAARAAVLKIAGAVYARHRAAARTAVAAVLEQAGEEGKEAAEARRLLERIDEYADFLTRWELAGPYTRPETAGTKLIDVAFPPEEKGFGLSEGWRPVEAAAEAEGVVDLLKLIGGSDRAVYLRACFWVPAAGPAELRLGTDDGVKAWLNGNMVHRNPEVRPVARDQDRAKVELRQGRNELVLKIVQGGGEWGACARFRTPDGKRLEGLTQEAPAPEVRLRRLPAGELQALFGGAGLALPPAWGEPGPAGAAEAAAADPWLGEWEGSLAGAGGKSRPIFARVIPLGHGKWRAVFLAALAGREAPLAELAGGDGPAGLELRDEAGRWRASAPPGGPLAGRGPEGSFSLERIFRLSPSLGVPAPPRAAVLFAGESLEGWEVVGPFPGLVDLAKELGAKSDAAAYLKARVCSPEAREAVLHLGSDDGVQAWFNGVLVHTNAVERGVVPIADRVPVTLARGWNTLLLKVANVAGGWAACARLTDPENRFLPGLVEPAGPGGATRSIEAAKGFLTAWEVSGPYAIEGLKGLDLLRVSFAAENPRGGGSWRALAPVEPGPPWRLVAPAAMEVKGGTGSLLTLRHFGDSLLHVEFRTPLLPEARGQARGNSGVYLQGRYEIQVLDSFGLEGRDDECGGIYKVSAPAANMCLPPLQWQTYDILFRAPRFSAAGAKTEPARVTVLHNGVAIHRDLVLPGPTGGAVDAEGPLGGILLQDHGQPVRYRNLWLLERK